MHWLTVMEPAPASRRKARIGGYSHTDARIDQLPRDIVFSIEKPASWSSPASTMAMHASTTLLSLAALNLLHGGKHGT